MHVPDHGSDWAHGRRAKDAKITWVTRGYKQQKRTLHIATYNVRTLSTEQKVVELEEEEKRQMEHYGNRKSKKNRKRSDQTKIGQCFTT